MAPPEMKIRVQDVFGLDPTIEKIINIIYRLDPPYLKAITDKTNLPQIQIRYAADRAKLEAQIKTLEAQVLKDISKELAKISG